MTLKRVGQKIIPEGFHFSYNSEEFPILIVFIIEKDRTISFMKVIGDYYLIELKLKK